MMFRIAAAVWVATAALCLAGCAGPHGEKPALDNAVAQPGGTKYGFAGGYVGATGGGFH